MINGDNNKKNMWKYTSTHTLLQRACKKSINLQSPGQAWKSDIYIYIDFKTTCSSKKVKSYHSILYAEKLEVLEIEDHEMHIFGK